MHCQKTQRLASDTIFEKYLLKRNYITIRVVKLFHSIEKRKLIKFHNKHLDH